MIVHDDLSTQDSPEDQKVLQFADEIQHRWFGPKKWNQKNMKNVKRKPKTGVLMSQKLDFTK